MRSNTQVELPQQKCTIIYSILSKGTFGVVVQNGPCLSLLFGKSEPVAAGVYLERR